jgi:peptide deformylase
MKSWIWMLALGVSFAACYTVPQENEVFSEAERELIFSGDSTEAMRVLLITNPSDSVVLRTSSDSIDLAGNEDEVRYFSERLYRTVTDSMSLGVGIAAPQVGILQRMIWVQRFDKEQLPFECYINPEIRQFSTKKQDCREGCLSIPNRSDTLSSRSYAILLEYETLDGDHQLEMVEGFTAVIFQHEIDHLNGILYTDHLEEEQQAARRRSAESGE